MYTDYKVQRISKKLQYHVILLLFFSLKDTKICVRGSLGLKIGQDCENLFATPICVNVDEAKPFQTAAIKLYVRADLQLSKDGLLFEHRVSLENSIEY